ncbi:hypothetical protein Z042_23400 [Chania multitudinisentens RB-25]|uniref:Uncharacterized protein n=1 Tax=Chania multitudinisentens RB-25 TaxID=1441930 RepID=W0LED3_9GAMM|nr:hypothetical protein [Chania multitudinisentens]AHG22223.1 hypothetical protein Z042_23400 [Chania multitudinisentens RB-25]
MAPNKGKPEEVMTFGELIALIADQKRRLNVLEIAFSYLAFSLDDKANHLLIHSLKLEAQNQSRDAETQKHFAHLATELESHTRHQIIPPVIE